MADRWASDGLEVGEYIASFKSSSSRVRWVIFIIATVSIVVLTANWNGVDWSWARHRERLWAIDQIADARALLASPPSESEERVHARQLLARARQLTTDEARETLYREIVKEKVRADYLAHVAEEYWVLRAPGVPAATDVNELGLLAGLTLNLLMLLLLFSLMRKYENLYLCSFKILRLFERDGSAEDGESRANFLYHALAMGEVLGAPPTLARWHHHRITRDMLAKVVFVVPAAVHGFVVWTNMETLDIAIEHFGQVPSRFWIQFALLSAIVGLTVPCFLYLRACHKCWRGLFYSINPGKRTAAPETSWSQWIGLRSRWSKDEKTIRKALEGELAKATAGGAEGTLEEAETTTLSSLPADWLTGSKVPMASLLLMKTGRDAARRLCTERQSRYAGLIGHKLLGTTPHEKWLDVEISWRFRRR